MKINFDKIIRKDALRRDKKKELFTDEFQDSLNNFIYNCSGFENVAKKENSKFLFKKYNAEFKIEPIFQFLEKETKAENERYGNTTFAVYNFNENDAIKKPIRMDITSEKTSIPNLKNLKKNGKELVALIDIEFYEKVPLFEESKNKELKDFIKEYSTDGS